MIILVVDDDATVRRNLRRQLREDFPGTIVVEADGAAEALPIMSAILPSLVLLDLTMPRGHGYALFKTIATTWPKIPIILMTDPNPTAISLAGVLGAAGHLTKREVPRCLSDLIGKTMHLDHFHLGGAPEPTREA